MADNKCFFFDHIFTPQQKQIEKCLRNFTYFEAIAVMRIIWLLVSLLKNSQSRQWWYLIALYFIKIIGSITTLTLKLKIKISLWLMIKKQQQSSMSRSQTQYRPTLFDK